jgi:hypothetical protein
MKSQNSTNLEPYFTQPAAIHDITHLASTGLVITMME